MVCVMLVLSVNSRSDDFSLSKLCVLNSGVGIFSNLMPKECK